MCLLILTEFVNNNLKVAEPDLYNYLWMNVTQKTNKNFYQHFWYYIDYDLIYIAT